METGEKPVSRLMIICNHSQFVCNKVKAKPSGSKNQTVFLQIGFGLCVVIAVGRRGNFGRRGRFGRLAGYGPTTCGIASL